MSPTTTPPQTGTAPPTARTASAASPRRGGPRWRGDAGDPLPPMRSNLAERATTRRMLGHVLASPCTRHGSRAGEPCWTWPSTDGPQPVRAACGLRIALTFHPTRRTEPR